MNTWALIMLLLLVCHMLGDFSPLVRPYMLAAKGKGWPVGPIMEHAAVHAMLMGAVAWCFAGPVVAFTVIGVQWITHGAIDIVKGLLSAAFAPLRNAATYWYWFVFGIDQLLHGAVIVAITLIILGT